MNRIAATSAPCFCLMDRRHPAPLIQSVGNILSLASLAYTFTALHSVRYFMHHHNSQLTAAHIPQPEDNNTAARNDNTSLLTYNVEDTSKEDSKSITRWTPAETQLLIEYVATNCVLIPSKGLSLTRKQFFKAPEIVKTRDSAQCHRKWTSVRVFTVVR